MQDGVAVLRFPSHIFQKKESAALTSAFLDLQEKAITRCVLDLGLCEYVSSDGLGATAQCWKKCKEGKAIQMALVLPADPSAEVRNLFDIIGLSGAIGSALQPTVADAIAYVKAFGSNNPIE